MYDSTYVFYPYLVALTVLSVIVLIAWVYMVYVDLRESWRLSRRWRYYRKLQIATRLRQIATRLEQW